MRKTVVLGFIAGALSVAVFHQGTVFLLHHQFPLIQKLLFLPDGFRPAGAGFSLRPVPPLGVPQILSICFWGGLWGIALAALLRGVRALPDLLTGLVFGAVACTLAGLTLVAAAKGLPMWAGGSPLAWWRGALFNGAWGWGTALLLRPMALRG